MDTLLNAVIPIFGLMAAGFAAGRFGVLGAGASQPLNRFVFYCALPALLFRSVASTPLGDVLRWDFILVFTLGIVGIAMLSLAASALALKESVMAALMRAVNATYGNVGYLGIPLAAVAYGERAVVAAGLTVLINAVVIIAPATAAVEIAARRGAGKAHVLHGVAVAVASNPLILSIVLGLVISAWGETLPVPIDTFLSLMADTAGPCALFALGLYVSGRPLTRLYGRLALGAVLKLAAFPALVWVLVVWVIPLDPTLAAVAILMAATPIGAGTFVLAERYGIDADETSTAIVVTTALSIPTLGLLLVLLS
ncbi:MAG: AEC family transporter [Alphaproteobacteria bacterium]